MHSDILIVDGNAVLFAFSNTGVNYQGISRDSNQFSLESECQMHAI